VLKQSAEPATGEYVPVLVTQAFPNSLLGEMAGWAGCERSRVAWVLKGHGFTGCGKSDFG